MLPTTPVPYLLFLVCSHSNADRATWELDIRFVLDLLLHTLQITTLEFMYLSADVVYLSQIPRHFSLRLDMCTTWASLKALPCR